MSDDSWEKWVHAYRRSGPYGQAGQWKRLTEEQKRYLKEKFQLTEPPEPPEPKRSPLVYGCVLTFGALMLLGFCVTLLDPDRGTRSPREDRVAKSQSPARVTTPSTKTSPASQPTRQYVYAKKRGVNIRKGPGQQHPVVEQTISEAQRLEYVSYANNWYKLIESPGKPDRYIHDSVVWNEAQKRRIDEAALLLLTWHWSRGYGYVTVEGQVKNVSGRSLRNIQAVVTWYDGNQNFITSSNALIDYNPVLPGQTSPFRVIARYNPAMQSARIDFKELLGGRVNWVNVE